MAARRDNKDAGNSWDRGFANRGRFPEPHIRNFGGFPPNPVPQPYTPIGTLPPVNNVGSVVNRFRKRIDKGVGPNRIPPVQPQPGYRLDLPNVVSGWRPSRNLGNVMHVLQDSLNLHPAVTPSNPFPFTVFRVQEAAQNVDRQVTRITGSVKGHKENGTR